MKSNKIYIVTAGEYSDYHIVGVFSTKRRANEFIGDAPRAANGVYENNYIIQECAVDTLPNLMWRMCYRVNIDCAGNIIPLNTSETIEEVSPLDIEDLKGTVSIIRDYSGLYDYSRPYNRSRPKEYPVKGFYGVSYESKEHALKLAVECRQKWLRKNA